MNFSSRTAWDLSENSLAAAVRQARDSGRELLDLTVSNPTACGFSYAEDELLRPLSVSAAMLYEPHAMGMLHARQAVAGYYRDQGVSIGPAHICLTTSTSEAYSFLFRLLCNPDDEVLVARPSYPLFDFLAQLDDVRMVEYPLLYDEGWHIDLHALERAITAKTRAVIVVHPNNPTGNFASDAERQALDALCRKHDMALIVDEVFLDYAFDGQQHSSFAARTSSALTFVLSGVSKVCALPQMKLSWMVAAGPERVAQEAVGRLEVIADTFLSVGSPTQYALSHWLAARGYMQQQIVARVRGNLLALDERLSGTLAGRLVAQGGWTAVLRVPRHVGDVPFAEAALERGVLVQPGEFYGLPEGRAVLSLLTPPDVWQRGLVLLPV